MLKSSGVHMEGNYLVRPTCHSLHTLLKYFAGFVAETTTFIAECAEDENDLVVKEANRLKNAVEGVAGNINELEI